MKFGIKSLVVFGTVILAAQVSSRAWAGNDDEKEAFEMRTTEMEVVKDEIKKDMDAQSAKIAELEKKAKETTTTFHYERKTETYVDSKGKTKTRKVDVQVIDSSPDLVRADQDKVKEVIGRHMVELELLKKYEEKGITTTQALKGRKDAANDTLLKARKEIQDLQFSELKIKGEMELLGSKATDKDRARQKAVKEDLSRAIEAEDAAKVEPELIDRILNTKVSEEDKAAAGVNRAVGGMAAMANALSSVVDTVVPAEKHIKHPENRTCPKCESTEGASGGPVLEKQADDARVRQ